MSYGTSTVIPECASRFELCAWHIVYVKHERNPLIVSARLWQNASESTRNLISLYFKGMTLAIWNWDGRKVMRHPSTSTKSRLPSLASGLASVRIEAIADVLIHRKLRICYTIPYPTLYFARENLTCAACYLTAVKVVDQATEKKSSIFATYEQGQSASIFGPKKGFKHRLKRNNPRRDSNPEPSHNL